jgi:hypothetical protein
LLSSIALLISAPTPKSRSTQIRVPFWIENQAAEDDKRPGAEQRAGISGNDIQATLDGIRSRVLDIKCPHDELIILLVLDLSSGDLTVVDPAKEALAAETKKLPPTSYIGLLRAQDGLRVLIDPTANRDSVVQEIEQQTLSGKSGLLNTVETAGRIADSMLMKSAVRVAVLYVTDSDVRNYREDFTNPVINSSDSHDLSRRFPETLVQEKIVQLEAMLSMQQAPLFIVSLSQSRDRLNEAYQNGLKRMAEVAGGIAFFSRSTIEIPSEIQKAIETISAHYSVTLAVPERVSTRPQIRLALPERDHALSYRTRFVMRGR